MLGVGLKIKRTRGNTIQGLRMEMMIVTKEPLMVIKGRSV